MTEHTTHLNLPKPEDGEPPDGPTQIGALADALDVTKFLSRNLKPTLGLLSNGGSVSLGLTNATLLEFDITPEVASKLVLIGSVQIFTPPSAAIVEFLVDGVAAGGIITRDTDGTCPPILALPSLAAEKHTVKLVARRGEGSGGSVSLGGADVLYALFAS